MKTLYRLEHNLEQLKKFAKKLALKSIQGDIFLLKGELGVGKTTFARSFINSLFDINKIKKPENIKSPSFPILINYPLLNYEINHYDLYRLANKNELFEIIVFEDFYKNISIVEWPEIILKNYKLKNFYLIEFEYLNLEKRSIKVMHSNK